jgi:hypothetical protein
MEVQVQHGVLIRKLMAVAVAVEQEDHFQLLGPVVQAVEEMAVYGLEMAQMVQLIQAVVVVELALMVEMAQMVS